MTCCVWTPLHYRFSSVTAWLLVCTECVHGWVWYLLSPLGKMVAISLHPWSDLLFAALNRKHFKRRGRASPVDQHKVICAGVGFCSPDPEPLYQHHITSQSSAWTTETPSLGHCTLLVLMPVDQLCFLCVVKPEEFNANPMVFSLWEIKYVTYRCWPYIISHKANRYKYW